MHRFYELTVAPDSPWTRMSATARRNVVMAFWVVSWGLIVLGFQEPYYWELAIAWTVVNALLVTALVNFSPLVFPAQLRFAYVAWLALGTYVPDLRVMMHITAVGLAANLATGYCPLARTLYLFPWNRTSPMSLDLLVRTFIQPPRPGRFEVAPASPK
jgi:hypothetical protein